MVIPYSVDPPLGLQLLDQEFGKSVPTAKFEFVTVTFNSTANTDTDITHSLGRSDVDWQVVNLSFVIAPATTPCIYRNVAGTARPWGAGYIILRCNVASVQATLLLSLRRNT